MGSHEARVDVELTEDMMIVRSYLRMMSRSLLLESVHAIYVRVRADHARRQSSRTAYIAYVGELLRLRQHAVLQYAAEMLMLRFRAVRWAGSDVVRCLL